MRTIPIILALFLFTNSIECFGQVVELDSLKKELSLVQSKDAKARIYSRLADLSYRNNAKRAIAYADSALSIAKSQKSLKDVYRDALYLKGTSLEILGRTKDAKIIFSNFIELSKKDNDSISIAKGNYVLGGYEFQIGNFGSAIAYFQSSYNYADGKDEDFAAKAVMNIGSAYSRLGNYDAAAKYLHRSINQLEILNNVNTSGLATRLLGNAYFMMEDFESSKKSFKKSLSYAIKARDSTEIAESYQSIGAVYVNQDSLQLAEEYYLKSLVIFENLDNTLSIMYAKTNLAELRLKQNKIDEAKSLLSETLDYSRQNDQYLYIANLINKGEAMLKSNTFDEAESDFEEALAKSNEIGASQSKLLALQGLLNVYKLTGQSEKSHRTFDEIISLKDSILNSEKIQKIEGIRIQYDSERKEREIKELNQQNLIHKLNIEKQQASNKFQLIIIVAFIILTGLLLWLFISKRKANRLLLDKNNTIIESNANLISTQDKLNVSIDEKDVLLKEVHHRVKNNLQIISSLLSLQARASNKTQNINEFLYNSQNRLESIALIHETLYNSDNLADVDMQKYIDKLSMHIFESNSSDTLNIKRNITIEPIFLNVQRVISVGLILSELITNCLKHAFPMDSGTVSISFKSINYEYQLMVSDDGIGFEDSIVESLGFDLIQSLAEQLLGRITLKSENGASVLLSFPIDEIIS